MSRSWWRTIVVAACLAGRPHAVAGADGPIPWAGADTPAASSPALSLLSCTSDADCDDGNPCFTDRCITGPFVSFCTHELKCNDEDLCTHNVCDLVGTCSYPPAACGDGNACNGIETCDPVFGCRAGTPVSCDDGDACTVDACNPATGSCSHPPLACSDGNACNGVETCLGGQGCKSGEPIDCSDGNPCTREVCMAPGGQCHRSPTYCESQAFQPGPWATIDNYSEDEGGAPWGLFALGESAVVHWRTDNVGSTPRAKAVFRVFGPEAGGGFVPGPWTTIDNYSEDKAGAPWGLFGLGDAAIVHWRTDNVGSTPRAKAVFRILSRQPDGAFSTGPWTTIDNYSEDEARAPWGLFAVGNAAVAHWRTDNVGSTPRAKAQFRVYSLAADGTFRPSAWTTIDNYSEDKAGAPWGLFALGGDSIVHWRTDNVGSAPRAKAQFRVYSPAADGTFQPAAWTAIENYSEDEAGAPWGLFALGGDSVVHWRTDNVGDSARRTGIFRPYRAGAGGLFAAEEWNGIAGEYADRDRSDPWGLVRLGATAVIHWRTGDSRQRVLFRAYRDN
jgi:hypothetical protein